ncbi:MAG: L-threonylcarbamoyladenylate synthase [Desulfobacteraceae bacterium]|nr:L-threonylcarbamoyladenylate synthase [Desulfobacteraceae bacterium]
MGLKDRNLQDLTRCAADVLRQGGVVAYPTETSYGLGASIEAIDALFRIYEIKRRPQDKPLLVIVKDPSWLERLAAHIPEAAYPIMEKFWPGPLTILFSARPGLPWPLCASTGKVGVRVSSHSVAAALVERLGAPITATSANLSGHPAANTAAEVMKQLGSCPKGLDFILDAGPAHGGQPSSIVDITVDPPVILRQGAVSREDILALCAKGRA